MQEVSAVLVFYSRFEVAFRRAAAVAEIVIQHALRQNLRCNCWAAGEPEPQTEREAAHPGPGAALGGGGC